MKKVLLFSAFIFLLAGCTELGEPPMHPSGWTDPQSEDSHMAKIAEASTETCRPCHGGIEKHDFFGGTSGVSCYQCHAGGPSGHPAFDVWIVSHQSENKVSCKPCHGNDYRGGLAEVSCYTCHETF